MANALVSETVVRTGGESRRVAVQATYWPSERPRDGHALFLASSITKIRAVKADAHSNEE